MSFPGGLSRPWVALLATACVASLAVCAGCAGDGALDPDTDGVDAELAASADGLDRRFDQATWLTTHNAFNNYGDARWTIPNQSGGLRSQLDGGVRALMLDVHYWSAPRWLCYVSFGSDCYAPGVYLCHGDCGTVAGVTYALPRRSFADALGTVVGFLRDNPREVVTLFLEDYTSQSQLKAAFDQAPQVADLIFDPASPAWRVRERGWPTLREMVQANKRLLIFTDRGENKGIYGIAHGRDYTVENYWSIGDLGNDYNCVSRWGDIPLNAGEAGWNRLFVMNQFRNVPTVISAALDNTYDNLDRRVDQYCSPAAGGKLPNYVAVDFFEVPGGSAKRYVDDLSAAR